MLVQFIRIKTFYIFVLAASRISALSCYLAWFDIAIIPDDSVEYVLFTKTAQLAGIRQR